VTPFDPVAVAADAEVSALPVSARRVYFALLTAAAARGRSRCSAVEAARIARRVAAGTTEEAVAALEAADLLCHCELFDDVDVLTPDRRNGARVFAGAR